MPILSEEINQDNHKTHPQNSNTLKQNRYIVDKNLQNKTKQKHENLYSPP